MAYIHSDCNIHVLDNKMLNFFGVVLFPLNAKYLMTRLCFGQHTQAREGVRVRIPLYTSIGVLRPWVWQVGDQ